MRRKVLLWLGKNWEKVGSYKIPGKEFEYQEFKNLLNQAYRLSKSKLALKDWLQTSEAYDWIRVASCPCDEELFWDYAEYLYNLFNSEALAVKMPLKQQATIGNQQFVIEEFQASPDKALVIVSAFKPVNEEFCWDKAIKELGLDGRIEVRLISKATKTIGDSKIEEAKALIKVQ